MSSTLDVFNPSNGELISTLEQDTRDQALAKLERAHQRFRDKKNHLPLHERIALLEKLLIHVDSEREKFLDTMVREGGKPLRDSIVEFDRALKGIKLAIGSVSEHRGSSIPLGYQLSSSNRLATTQCFPRGVVLAFSAFNHPLNLIVHQIIPAFASGCPCIVKPASDTPLSCALLVQAMHDVGIPEDYIDIVIIKDTTLSGELVESDNIAFFSFIGSARVGWMLRSKLKPGVRCALEHGGVAPCIVTANADLELAAKGIAKGGFYHAGQVCVSTQRVFVDSTVMAEFSERLVEQMKPLIVGDASDEKTDVGPLIREQETERVDEWVKEAIEQGAECIQGGNKINSRFYEPTLLINPTESAKVSTHEIFGPVVCLYSYDELESVFEQANHKRFSFQASIFSQDIDEIMLAFQHVNASAFMVNDHTAFRDDVMPFAGLDQSGLGVGGIPYTIEDMQYEKMLVIKH